jgi:hypothetical protein
MSAGRLRLLAFATSALMIAAALNETLGYVLFTLDHPGTGFQTYVPITLIGAVPFLVTGLLIGLAARGLAPGSGISPLAVQRIRQASGLGLLPIAIGGFWSGLGLAFLGADSNSSTGIAVFVYQFILVGAVVADLVLLVATFLVKPTSTSSGG